jgi:hypothetical protein
MEPTKAIAPLFDKTPLAIERLELIWESLSVLDRAEILTVLLGDSRNDPGALRWRHHRERVVDLGMADESPYVRYVAAKDVSEPRKEREETQRYRDARSRFQKVRGDPFTLVRLAGEEKGWKFLSSELKEPTVFWSLPQAERLVSINGLEEHGERVAELLRFATKDLLPQQSVTVEEMLDVLLQYLGGKSISERVADAEEYARRFTDGFAECSAGESVKALWALIPDVPKELAYVLLESLPPDAGFQSDLPNTIVASLDEDQLATLLYRDDIPLKELRRKLFLEGKANDHLRSAAISSIQFELLDSDISPLVFRLEEPKDSACLKVDQIADLAQTCAGASLAQMEALCYLIRAAPAEFHSGMGKWDAAAFGSMQQSRRAKKLARQTLQQEVRHLRLFLYATQLTPLVKGNPVYGRLAAQFADRKEILVPGNPWETYLNLKGAVRDWGVLESELSLATIEDFEIPKDIQNEAPTLDDNAGESPDADHKVFDLLSDVQDRVKDISDTDRAELYALGNALSQLSGQTERLESAAMKRMLALEAQVSSVAGSTKLLMWLTIAVLLVLIFKESR